MDEVKILLVEDEAKIANALKKGLQEAGYATEVAYDGIIAKKIFFSRTFQLVVLDINLPGINGYSLCRQIRDYNQQIPIIMLTALNATDDKLEGFDAGADDYIVKPFEFKELLARIKTLLKRSNFTGQPVGTVLRVADLEMNLGSKEVKRGDKKISLTAKEFQLLEYFMRNRNRVLSRADIAEQVWEIDFDTQTNVIDVYINYLRNKIDKTFDTKLIHTHIGMGYILKDE